MQELDLTKLSYEELDTLKALWLEDADQDKKFDKLKKIASVMGESCTEFNFPEFKRVTVTAQGAIEIQLNYYPLTSNDVEVKVAGKHVAHNAEDFDLYIPGWWEQYIFPLYDLALEKEALAIQEALEHQRQQLIEELTLPALPDHVEEIDREPATASATSRL